MESVDYEPRKRPPSFGDAEWSPPLAAKAVLVVLVLLVIAAPVYLACKFVLMFIGFSGM